MAKAAKGKSGKKKFKSRTKKSVPVGVVHIQATFNNPIVTITDPDGNVLSWSSSGSLGFRGSQKGTPFAAQQASLTAANAAKDHGLRQVSVRVKGPGGGRESAIRAFATVGIHVTHPGAHYPVQIPCARGRWAVDHRQCDGVRTNRCQQTVCRRNPSGNELPARKRSRLFS
jgi:small subunit ribosomal protein S11